MQHPFPSFVQHVIGASSDQDLPQNVRFLSRCRTLVYLLVRADACVVVFLCICVRRDGFRDLAMRVSLVVRSYALRVGLRVRGSIHARWHTLGTPPGI